jgi:D-3-phosphoglycerate dehydrogenase / 2-oxoglutarate reductase
MQSSSKWKVWWVEPTPVYWNEGKIILEKNNCDVIIAPVETRGSYDENEVITKANDADAILLGATRITAKVLDNLKNLKVIIKSGVGVDNIDVEAATRNGVIVANTPVAEDYIGVAEGTVARILALAKGLRFSDSSVKQGSWSKDYDKLKGIYLRNQVTIGILGFGRIGSFIARLMRPWNVNIIAYDPYIHPDKAELFDIKLVDFNTLLADSDFLSINSVLTPETKHIIDEQALRKMKKSAFIINTARGSIIDENALCKALSEGWISGASLDVFEQEPPVGQILSPSIADKLLLSPHTSGLSDEMARGLMQGMVAQCLAASRSEVPAYALNNNAIKAWKQKYA